MAGRLADLVGEVFVRRFGLYLLDLFLVAAGTLLAVALRDNLVIDTDRLGALVQYTFITLIPAATVLAYSGIYRVSWRHVTGRDYRALVSLGIVIVVCAQFAGFAIDRLEGVARAVPFLQVLLIPVLMIGARFIHKSAHAFRRSAKALPVEAPVAPADTTLLIGINPVAELYATCARQHASQKSHIAGIITRRGMKARGSFAYGLPVLGSTEDITRAIHELAVHGIYVNRLVVAHDTHELDRRELAELDSVAEQHDLRVEYLPEVLGFAQRPAVFSRLRASAQASVTPLPLMEIEMATRRPYWVVKRGLDTLVSAALLVVFSPLVLVLAIGTAVSLGFPIVFWQVRPGRFGREFRLYKFRSMRSAVSSDGRLVKDELRQTAFGRMMRSKRLDELPQLWNVLKGEMSFVGPRPLVAIEQKAIPSARLLVRPELTGWAQVKGGRSISVADKAALDLWYIRNATLWLDIRILLATVDMVMRGERVDPDAISDARDIVEEPLAVRHNAQ